MEVYFMAENIDVHMELIEIIAAEPLNDMKMILTFSNGERRLFDAKILDGSAFEPLKNEKIFNDIKIVDGVVTWQNETIDCAPEYMYIHSSITDENIKNNNHAFILDEKKADAFLNRKIPASTDAIARFEKRKRKGEK